jgi:hypothetical protein
MDQTTIVRNLSAWLRATLWHPSVTVLHDLASWGVRGESVRGAFYIGRKERGRGRFAQVAQADILGVTTSAPSSSLSRLISEGTDNAAPLRRPHRKP